MTILKTILILLIGQISRGYKFKMIKRLVPTQSRQQYGIPTYDALFKYVLDDPSLQSSFFHAFAGLDVATATRIDEHMNPRQELKHLRTIINDYKSIRAVSSIRSKDGISVSYQGINRERVHKGFTKFVKAILPNFDDLRRAFPKPLNDGTMDFVCKLSNGEYVMVEMQVIPYDSWDALALGYVAAFYGKQIREGDNWKDIKRVIGINILGGGKEEWEHMRQYPARYIGGIEIIHYSLMHTPQSLEDTEKKDWLTFFKEASYMTEENVREKISTPAVLEAFERAKLLTLPDCVREMYVKQESEYAQYSIHTREQIEQGKAEGIVEGIVKGKAEGIVEGKAEGIVEGIVKGKAEERVDIFCNLIKNMKCEGKSNQEIMKTLSLSDEEFQKYIRLIGD